MCAVPSHDDSLFHFRQTAESQLDLGQRHASAVSGAMNTAGQVGSFLLSISYGYMVRFTGDYDVPLLVVAAALGAGALLWLKIDPTRGLTVSEDG